MISGAQNLNGGSRFLPGHWALRRRGFRIPRFARVGQSSLTPSLLLSNANPLRWVLRWGPPSAAYLGGKFRRLQFHGCAWLCCANALVRILAGAPRGSPTKTLEMTLKPVGGGACPSCRIPGISSYLAGRSGTGPYNKKDCFQIHRRGGQCPVPAKKKGRLPDTP